MATKKAPIRQNNKKSTLRNLWARKYETDPNIYFPDSKYKQFKPDHVIVDGLTRMHSSFATSHSWQSGANGDTTASVDGGAMMTKIATHFDFFFERGAINLIWVADKSEYVPMTKGVEQLQRRTASDRDIQPKTIPTFPWQIQIQN